MWNTEQDLHLGRWGWCNVAGLGVSLKGHLTFCGWAQEKATAFAFSIRAACRDMVIPQMKCLHELECWTHSGCQRNPCNWGFPLSPPPPLSSLIPSSIIWVIWSWGHKFLYNANPLCREESSGNDCAYIPDSEPKVLEPIWSPIKHAPLSSFHASLEAGHTQLFPPSFFVLARAVCREAPCWCWLAMASAQGRCHCQLCLACVNASIAARESCCQAGRHMLSPCLAISRSQRPRPFNSSKPQAFW